MSKFKQLINCHSHSDSSLDGASTVSDILKRNQELGATHTSLTEHGNLNSAMDLYTKAKKYDQIPILGMEAYLVNPFHEEYVQMYRKAYQQGVWKPRIKDTNLEAIERAIQAKAMNQYLHITIHFKDKWAYQYFCGLSKAMWDRAIKKFDELKPMLTMDELRGAAGHITIGSGCLKGPLQNFLLPSKDGIIKADPEKSQQMYRWLKEISGDDFFIEVFPHEITSTWVAPEKDHSGNIVKQGYFKPHECTCDMPDGDLQHVPNQFVLNLAEQNKEKVLISLDSHFAYERQRVVQEARLGQGDEQWKFSNSYHVMSTDEAADILQKKLKVSDKKIEEWVDNSYEWASKFNNFKLETSKDRWVLVGDSDRFLSKMKSTIDKWGRMDWSDKEMMDRLKYEIQVLAYNGTVNLLSYFETIEDISSFCRENNVLMNVRGSASGSLLLYLIGVSAVNPLKHDLSFARFLTEGRINANSIPDVDMDVSNQEKVIEYIKNKYGESYCRLSTDLLLRLKSSIKDAERAVFGKVNPETEKMCTKLPSAPQGTDDHSFVFGYEDSDNHVPGLLETNPALNNYAAKNPTIWNTVVEMMGIQRSKSSHACGLLIADAPITNYIPIIKVGDEWVTAFSPKAAEAAGLVKFDLLGLNTLRDIQLTVQSIKERTGEVVDPFNLPQDPLCYEKFAQGITDGVFQFDTPTVRPFLMKVKPQDVEGLAALTSLCRPGTLDAPNGDGRTLAEVYVARALGEPITYVHNDLEPILKGTYGVQLFQEQTIRIFQDIGGMTDAEADEVRRGIGKKDRKVLDKASSILREKCISRGWTEEQVNLLVDQILASSNYGFNKSHAISYSYTAYACMYLKTHYKLDWWKALLTNSTKEELATKFWKSVQDFTDLPDINMSSDEYKIIEDRIITPLSILTGVGEKAYEDLIRHRPYTSLEHFVSCHFVTKDEDKSKKLAKKAKQETGEATKSVKKSAVNVGIVHKIIAAGILDSLFDPDLLIEEKLLAFERMRGEVTGKKVEKVPEEYTGTSHLGKYLLKKQLIQVYSQDLRSIVLPNRGGKCSAAKVSPDSEMWYTQDGIPVLDGNQLEYFKNKFNQGVPTYLLVNQFDKLLPANSESINLSQISQDERRFYTVAYVISEKSFPYKNKTKYANKLVLDINGFFSEEILWPTRVDYKEKERKEEAEAKRIRDGKPPRVFTQEEIEIEKRKLLEQDVAPIGFKKLPVLASFYLSKRGVALGSITPLIKEEDLERFNMT
jgi:DNA-directed DNA polymerase III PolC